MKISHVGFPFPGMEPCPATVIVVCLVAMVTAYYVIIETDLLPIASIGVSLSRSQPYFAGNISRNTQNKSLTYFHGSPVEGATTEVCRLVLIDFRRVGRLGNTMYAFAAAVGVANKIGATPMWYGQTKMEYLKFIFEMRALSTTCHRRPNHATTVEASELIDVDVSEMKRRLNAIPQEIDIDLHGYFHSWLLFNDVSDVIRDQFRFVQEIRDEASRVLRSALRQAFPNHTTIDDVTTVGFHVRKGDPGGRWGVNLVRRGAREYFRRALTYMSRRCPPSSRILFIICSEDPPWTAELFHGVVQRHLANKGAGRLAVAYSHAGVAAVDMALLASCHHTIMTMGTFGWWAAYLSKGQAYYWRDYVTADRTNAEPTRRPLPGRTKYPPSWLGL